MQTNEPLKVVIDTNLWISFIISNKQNLLDALLHSGKIRGLFSNELINEIKTTIEKPKLKKYFTGNALDDMLTAFDPFIDLVDVKSVIVICRDLKDNFLLQLAIDGDADYILTGDKDLLILENYSGVKIITIATFLSLYSY